MAKQETKLIPFVPFDPWAGISPTLTQRQLSAMHEAERPPLRWFDLDARLRPLLGGLAVQILSRHRTDKDAVWVGGKLDVFGYLSARLTEALHATHTKDAEAGGFGHDLSGYYVADVDQRRLWRQLDIECGRFSCSIVPETLRQLEVAGDMVATLVARRAEIDAQLARLGASPEVVRASIQQRARQDHELLGGDAA